MCQVMENVGENTAEKILCPTLKDSQVLVGNDRRPGVGEEIEAEGQ
jgi:hypothetical protein